MAWAQKAKLEARSIKTSPIDLKTLTKNIPRIRKMTTLDPSDFCQLLINLLSNCGIALVFLPHIGGSFLHGATFYDGNKIVVGLTVRGKDADKFWFSLFHEFLQRFLILSSYKIIFLMNPFKHLQTQIIFYVALWLEDYKKKAIFHIIGITI